MKKQVILTAQTLGFFRTKDAEKQSVILAEMLELEEFSQADANEVGSILQTEVDRRHAVYMARAARAIDKAEKDAAKPISAGSDRALEAVQTFEPGLYVVTVAQNNTDVNRAMLGALENYCQVNEARLLIAKQTYNLTGFCQPGQDMQDGIYYDPALTKYLVEGHIDLGGIHFVASANVLPTAKNPLQGYESITPNGVDIIIPASKIALKCTASLKGSRGKILYSTGSITKLNYVQRKAGNVAATEHNIGALVVDSRVSPAIVRQLELMPDSHGFYDENRFYTVLDSYTAHPEVLQFGDIHAEKMTRENLDKMCKLIEKYKPAHIMAHDICDFSSRNHHNVKNAAFMFSQTVQGNTVEGDIIKVAEVLRAISNAAEYVDTGGILHIIESNHDLAINTWLNNMDFKQDPVNALTYLTCMKAHYEHIQANNGKSEFNMLEFALATIGKMYTNPHHPVKFHTTDESVIIAHTEHGCHGHTGVNGSRGSPTQFRGLGVAMNTGHTHTPSICGKVYTAGVSASLEMGYNIGASSWQLANILTYSNGQRQVIFM